MLTALGITCLENSKKKNVRLERSWGGINCNYENQGEKHLSFHYNNMQFDHKLTPVSSAYSTKHYRPSNANPFLAGAIQLQNLSNTSNRISFYINGLLFHINASALLNCVFAFLLLHCCFAQNFMARFKTEVTCACLDVNWKFQFNLRTFALLTFFFFFWSWLIRPSVNATFCLWPVTLVRDQESRETAAHASRRTRSEYHFVETKQQQPRHVTFKAWTL